MIQSLNGLRVLNTRPQKQGATLSKQIRAAGGIAIDCPTLEIQETNQYWINQMPPLNTVDQAIFISANAVEYCFRLLRKNKIIWPMHINVIAIGQASAQALHQYNIRVNNIPVLPDSEHLLALNTLQQIKNQTVLLFKGEEGRRTIEEGLLQKEAKVIALSVYKRTMPTICNQFINSIWHDDSVDIILLTSEQSIHNLFKLFHKEAHAWLQSKTCLVISKRLAQTATLLGMKKIIISHPNGMMNALFDYQGLIHGQ